MTHLARASKKSAANCSAAPVQVKIQVLVDLSHAPHPVAGVAATFVFMRFFPLGLRQWLDWLQLLLPQTFVNLGQVTRRKFIQLFNHIIQFVAERVGTGRLVNRLAGLRSW